MQTELSEEFLLGLYHQMQRIRYFEDTVTRLYRQGKVLGGVFTGQGQEAIPVGTCSALRETDFVSPIHRDLGVFLAKGMPANTLMAQVMGRANSPSRGKDSWTHTGDLRLGIIASSSMIGSSIPIACGVVLAERMKGKDTVVVSYFGEGATARGDFHEGLNFAGIHKLPAIFVCENNLYAYSTPFWKEMPVDNVADRACCYGMPGVTIDGNDVLIVWRRTMEAVERARRGEGPTLIECRTYRYVGHSAHDEATYRPPQEVEEWHGKDPVHRFHDCLVEMGMLTDEEARRIYTRVENEVREAVEFATNSPFPRGEETLEGVYAPPPQEAGGS